MTVDTRLDTHQLAQWLKVLAEPRRLQILNLLMEALPITAVRGIVIKSGAYPTGAEVEAALAGGVK